MNDFDEFLTNENLLNLLQNQNEGFFGKVYKRFLFNENKKIEKIEYHFYDFVQAFVRENKEHINLLALTDCEDGRRDNILLIEKLIKLDLLNDHLDDILIKTLKKEQFVQLPLSYQQELIKTLIDNNKFKWINYFLHNGYTFKQGHDEEAIECYAVVTGQFKAVEILLENLPDLDLNKKYQLNVDESKTLLEIAEEEMKVYSGQKKEEFIKIHTLIKNILTVKFFEQLDNTVKEKSEESPLKPKL